jgi:hypothetical protein
MWREPSADGTTIVTKVLYIEGKTSKCPSSTAGSHAAIEG